MLGWSVAIIFRTADDVSVTSSLMVTLLSCKYLMARLTVSLSIFGECSETSHLSKVFAWMMVLVSTSITEYVQYLALLPGESHLLSPANETVSLYSSITSSCLAWKKMFIPGNICDWISKNCPNLYKN